MTGLFSRSNLAGLLLLANAFAPAWAVETASVKTTTFRSVAHNAEGRLPTAGGVLAADVMAEDLESPWGFAFLPDGRVLVTEKSGRLLMLTAGNGVDGFARPSSQRGVPPPLKPSVISGPMPVATDRGQGGLLDIAISPGFMTDHTIFFAWSESVGGGTRTSVSRAVLSGTQLTDVRTIFSQSPSLRSAHHFGASLVFAADGNLLIGLGDRGQQAYAQALDNTVGKVVRIAPDGSIPPDNPFVGQAGINPAIWSVGHRNIQGAFLHPDTQKLWAIEHGPQGGDEINIVTGGENHGWPRITRGVDYGSAAAIGEGTSAPGFVEPLAWWTPVSIAPSGLAIYTGDKVASLQGKVLAGSLSARALISLELDGERIVAETRYRTDREEGIRQVRDGPDGQPWILTDAGRLLRVIAR